MTARSAESARREFLKRVVAGGVYFGAGSLGLPSHAARPIACLPTSPRAYRNSRPYLFQSVPSRTIANRLPGGGAYLWDIYGPTYRYVDYETGWLWSQPGGDWLDRNFVRFGSAPWFSVPVGAVEEDDTLSRLAEPFEATVTVTEDPGPCAEAPDMAQDMGRGDL